MNRCRATPEMVEEHMKARARQRSKWAAGDWVVTYRLEYDGGITIFEAYRGPEKECRRIADYSVAPNVYEEKKVTGFKTIIGIAAEWDEFLEEQAG